MNRFGLLIKNQHKKLLSDTRATGTEGKTIETITKKALQKSFK